jgi:hypothetical protein
MFTEWLFDQEAIRELAAEKAASLKANKGFSDLQGYALGVIQRRLEKDPLRYRDYGPYWWALKQVLNDNDRDLGAEDDALVRATYAGNTALETVVMADEFRTLALSLWPVGNNQFTLSEDGVYTLHDQDMEVLSAA